MNENKNVRDIYEALSRKSSGNIMPYEEFETMLTSDEDKRRDVYNVLSKGGNMIPFEQFNAGIMGTQQGDLEGSAAQPEKKGFVGRMVDKLRPKQQETPAPVQAAPVQGDFEGAAPMQSAEPAAEQTAINAEKIDSIARSLMENGTQRYIPSSKEEGEAVAQRLKEMRAQREQETTESQGFIGNNEENIAVAEEAQKETSKEKWRNLWRAFLLSQGGQPGTPSMAATGIMTPSQQQAAAAASPYFEEYAQNKLVSEMLDESLDYVNAVKNNSSLGQGFIDTATRIGTWDFGYSDLAKNLTLSALVDKAENGEPLTEQEDKILDLVALATYLTQGVQEGVGIGYNVGASLPESLGFMVSLALNPAGGYGKAVMERAAKKFGRRNLKTIGARAIGDAAEMGVATLTTGVGRTASQIMENMIGRTEYNISPEGYISYGGQYDQDNLGKAIWKGFMSQYIENYTEAVGEYFSPMVDGLKALTKAELRAGAKVAGTEWKKGALEGLADMIHGAPKSTWGKMVRDFKEATKFNGIVGEVLEEEIGMVMEPLIVEDKSEKGQALKENFLIWSSDPKVRERARENQLTTIFACSLMSGALYGVENVHVKGRLERQLRDADHVGKNELGRDWEDIRDRIDNADPEEMVREVKDIVYNPQYDAFERKAILDYASRLIQTQEYNTTSQLAREEMDEVSKTLSAAYDAGYRMGITAEPQSFRAVNNARIASEMRLEEMGLTDVAKQIEEADASTREQIMDGLKQDQRSALEYYLGCKQRQEGLYEGVKFTADSEVDNAVLDLAPAVYETADGTRMVTSATTADGRFVYVISQDGPMSIIVDMEGNKTPYPTDQLEDIVNSNADEVEQQLRKHYDEEIYGRLRFYEAHNAQTQEPTIGLVVGDGDATVIVTDVGDGWATVQEVTYDEDGNAIPKQDGKSRDVTKEYLLALQDDIYDRRDMMDGKVPVDEAAQVELTANGQREQLEARAGQWQKTTGQTVRFIDSAEQITNESARDAIAAGKPVTGWFDTATGEVCFYMPNIKDISEVDKTYIHEVVSHKGMRMLLGNDGYAALCDRVWNELMTYADKAEFLSRSEQVTGGDEARRLAAADEYIAYFAEQLQLDPSEENRTVWDRIVEIIKDILSRLGLGEELTTDELSQLLQASLARFQEENRMMQQAAAEQQEKKEPTALDKIPSFTNEKTGETDYMWTEAPSVRDALEAMKEAGYDNDIIQGYADDMIKELQAEAKKLAKPKATESMAKRQQNKATLADIDRRIKFWNDVNEYINALIEKEERLEKLEQLNNLDAFDDEFDDVYKAVNNIVDELDFANQVRFAAARHKYIWADDPTNGTKGFASHVFASSGNKANERLKNIGWLANRDKGGLYPEEAAEQIMADLPESITEGHDTMEALDIIIDAISSANNPGTIVRQMYENLIEGKQREEEKYYKERYASEQGFASFEDLTIFEELRQSGEDIVPITEEEQQAYDNFRAQEYEREENERVLPAEPGGVLEGESGQESVVGQDDGNISEDGGQEGADETGSTDNNTEGNTLEGGDRGTEGSTEGTEPVSDGAGQGGTESTESGVNKVQAALDILEGEEKKSANEPLVFPNGMVPGQGTTFYTGDYVSNKKKKGEVIGYDNSSDVYLARERDVVFSADLRKKEDANKFKYFVYFVKPRALTAMEEGKPARIMATRGYDKRGAETAHGIKDGEKVAIEIAANEMVYYINDGDILIPMPSRTGKADVTKKLADAILDLTYRGITTRKGVSVVEGLEGTDRESLYDIKKSGKQLPKPSDLNIHLNEAGKDAVASGRRIVVIDNVIATGTTAQAALEAIPGATILAYAQDKSVKPIDNIRFRETADSQNEKVAREAADVLERHESGEDFGSYRSLVDNIYDNDILMENKEIAGFVNEYYRLQEIDLQEGKRGYTGSEMDDMVEKELIPALEKLARQGGDIRFREANAKASLMGAHNLSEEKLRKVLKQGGLANPSMAIVDTNKHIHSGYGDISLIPYASQLDASKTRGVATYNGDAYTPSYPGISHVLTSKGEKKIDDMVKRLGKGDRKLEYFISSALYNHAEDNGTHLTYVYAADKGLNPQVVYEQPRYSKEEYNKLYSIIGDKNSSSLTKEEKQQILNILMDKKQKDVDQKIAALESKEAEGETKKWKQNYLKMLKGNVEDYRKKITDENGEIYFAPMDTYIYEVRKAERLRQNPEIDGHNTRDAALQQITDNGLTDDYWKWVDNLFTDEEWPEKLFAGWTPSGNKRLVPNTLENASKLMNKQGDKNADDSNGYNATKSTRLIKMRTLSDIRKMADRLVSTETYDEIMEQRRQEWFEIVSDLRDMQRISDNHYSDLNYAENRLQEAILKSDPIGYLNREYGYDIDKDSEFAKELKTAIENMDKTPAKYFETKFTRPVYLYEFKTAIAPNNMDAELRRALKKAGINVVDYKANDADDYERKVREATEGDADVRFRVANTNQAIFVSNAQKAVENIKQEKATPEQWLAMIQSKGGLKAGEDKWLGLSQYLKGMESMGNETIEKYQILDFIRRNKIQIEEQWYGGISAEEAIQADIQERIGEGRTLEELQEEFDAILENADEEIAELSGQIDTFEAQMLEKYGEKWDEKLDNTEQYRYDEMTIRRSQWLKEPSEAAFREMVNNYGDDFEMGYFVNGQGYLDYNTNPFDADEVVATIEGTRPINDTRLKYTTDGLENKREIALTIPTIESWNVGDYIHFGDAGYGRAIGWIRFGDTYTGEVVEEADAAWNSMKKYLDTMAEKYGPGVPYEDFSEEDKAEGERLNSEHQALDKARSKVLVIDEIQSERHQEGRKKGYMENALESLKANGLGIRETKGERGEDRYETYWLEDGRANSSIFKGMNGINDMKSAAKYMLRNMFIGSPKDAIPAAPFEKNWPELCMKRMLRLAAEEGYDKLAWTSGEVQADRYDLGQVVKSIFAGIDQEGNRVMLIHANEGPTIDITHDDQGNIIKHNGAIEGLDAAKNISDLVGKEIAADALTITEKGTANGREYKDDALRVGISGMQGFYDKMLPAFMTKYGKQWGVKPELQEFPDIYGKFWTIDVTPEMKADVMEGQVMFRIGDNEQTHELNAKQKQPGEELKIIDEDIENGIIPSQAAPITEAEVKTARESKLVQEWRKHKNRDLARFFGSIPVFVRDFAEATLGIDNKYGLDNRVYYQAAEEMDYIMDYARERGLDESIAGKYDFKDGETLTRLIEDGKSLYTEEELAKIEDTLPKGGVEALHGALQAFEDEKKIREEMERIQTLNDGKTMEDALTLYVIVYSRLKRNYEGDDRYFHTQDARAFKEPSRVINNEIFKEIIRRIASAPIKRNMSLEDMTKATDDIRFRLSKNNRKTVESWLNKRTDIDAAERESTLAYIDSLDDAKTQLATGWWFSKGTIRLPEDMPKVEQAVAVSTIAKVDPLQYSSPMELINAHAGIEVKEERINPDNVKTLHWFLELPEGIVIYNVDNTEESRQNMREIINTHFGKESSPWCLLQGDENGKLTGQSREYWDYYSAYPKQVAFKDGKLLAFSANNDEEKIWWDRMDESSKGIPIEGKLPGDPLDRSAKRVMDVKTGHTTIPGFLYKGNRQDGEYLEWWDKDNLRRREHYKGGHLTGLMERWYPNGQKSVEAHYDEPLGRQNRSITLWWDNGQVRQKAYFVDGYEQGETLFWYPNGQLNIREVHHSDILATPVRERYKRVEPYEEWYEDGTRKEYIPYDKDGVPNGTSKFWYSDGTLSKEQVNKDGTTLSEKTYWQNGQLNSVENWNEEGYKDGPKEVYTRDGKPIYKRNYKNGEMDGRWELYWENGNLRYVTNYKDGQEVGEKLDYWRNGNLSTKLFRDDRGRKQGEEREYLESGELRRLTNWKNDVRDGLTEMYNKSGQVSQRSHYKNGQLDGVQEYFNESGKVISRVYYKDGVRVDAPTDAEQLTLFRERRANEAMNVLFGDGQQSMFSREEMKGGVDTSKKNSIFAGKDTTNGGESDIQRKGDTAAGSSNRAGSNGVQRKDGIFGTDPSRLNQKKAEDIIPPLRKLEEGETCVVQRKMTEDKNFNFTVGNKIETYDDIAYIFKQLETKSVENCFVAMYGDNIKETYILHLSMGGLSSASVDLRLVLPMVKAVNPTNICLVHNHPSGNIYQSRQDEGLLLSLRTMMAEFAPNVTVDPGIIIDTTKGVYGIFGDGPHMAGQMPEKVKGEKKIPVYNFDESVFAPDYEPEKLETVRSSKAIAIFASNHRLGERDKVSVLCLDQAAHVVGNFFTDVTKIDSLEAARRVASQCADYAGACGATAIAVFGTGVPDRATAGKESIAAMNYLYQAMNKIDIRLLDALSIDGEDYDYYSYADHGIFESGIDYGTRFRVSDGIENRSEDESPRDFVKRIRKDFDGLFKEVAPIIVMPDRQLIKPEFKVRLNVPYDANINKAYEVYESMFEDGKIKAALGWNLSNLGINKTAIFAREGIETADQALTIMIHENVHAAIADRTPDELSQAAAAILKWSDKRYGTDLNDNWVRKLYKKLSDRPAANEDNEIIAYVVGYDQVDEMDRERVKEYIAEDENTSELFNDIINKTHNDNDNGNGGRRNPSDERRGGEETAGEAGERGSIRFRELADAEAQVDTNPTEGQKEAGNYKKGHIRLFDMDLSIEQPLGSVRRGTDKDGKEWEQKMNNTYGYIRGTMGRDKDHIDFFLGPNLDSDKVYIIDQRDVKSGAFDEHKIMLGFDSMDEARDAYNSNYEQGWNGLGAITEVSLEDFKEWAFQEGRRVQPYSDNVRFRIREPEEYERIENALGIAAGRYERAMDSMGKRLTEVVQDSMRSVKELQDALSAADGKPIRDYENAYWAAIQYSSRNKAMQEVYNTKFFRPLMNEVAKQVRGNSNVEEAMNELTTYLMAKHGLERNEVFARRDAKKEYEDYVKRNPNTTATEDDFYQKKRQRDYSGLIALTNRTDDYDAIMDERRENLAQLEESHRLGLVSDEDYEKEAKRIKKTARSEVAKLVKEAEDDARIITDNYEQNHETSELWNRINAATKETLRTSYQGGFLSEDKYKELATMFDYYVPLRGFDETTSDDVYGYYGTVNSPYNTAIKKAYGRHSLADSPLATIANIADSEIMRVNRNRIYNAALLLAENHHNPLLSVSEVMFKRNPQTGEWEIALPQIDVNDSPDEVSQKMTAYRTWFAQQLMADPMNYRTAAEMADVPYKVISKSALNEHQIMATRGGKKYIITVNGNPRAAQALAGKTNPDSSPALQWLAPFNRYLAAVFTQYNPAFVLGNLTRDGIYTNAMVWAKEDPKYAIKYDKNWGKSMLNMASLLKKYKKGTLDDNVPMERYFKEFIESGGETGYTQLHSVKDYKKIMQRELKDVTDLTPAAAARKVMGAIGDAVENMNRWAEGVSRFAAYITSREQGRSITRSVEDAKEISVNFNKKGSGVAAMTDKDSESKFLMNVARASQLGRELFVFFNAGVQGMENATGTISKNPKKGTALMVGLFSLGMAMAYMNGGDGDDDDEKEYYNLPEYIRRSNICIKAGKHWVTIPLPIELRALYGLGELAYSYGMGNEYYDGKELAYEVASQFSQILPIDFLEGNQGTMAFIPSMVKPIVEAYWLNQDWTGSPIYNQSPYNENDPEWRKAFRSANPTLVAAARKLNEMSGGGVGRKGVIDVNPARLEHLFEGYLGGVGTILNQAYKSTKALLGDEDLQEVRNIPVVSRFVRDADGRAAVRSENARYYKVGEFVDEVMNEERRLRQMMAEKSITGYDYGEEEIKEAEKELEKIHNSPEWAFAQEWKSLDRARNATRENAAEEDFNRLTKEMNELYYKFRKDKRKGK